jgi:FkbM family methyltransferase
MSRFKRLIHQGFGALGLEVHSKKALRLAYEREISGRELRAWSMLRDSPVGHVLDIGANSGQFASIARQIWPKAEIDSFEPLPHVFEELLKAHGHDRSFRAHRLALGRSQGSATMQSNDFSPSSSLLALAPLHQQEWPEANSTRLIEVPVRTLDSWARERPLAPGPLFVKIDVQGYEIEVIEGGLSTLVERTDWLCLEVSFYELYDKQPLFHEIYTRLAELGFLFRGHVQQFMNKQGTQILFADALFENSARPSNA